MTMARHRVCLVDDIPLDRGQEHVIEGRVVAVFRTADGVFATDGICPHAGGPLAQGMVRKNVVTCPWHGWQFNIQTGCHQLNSRVAVPTYPVQVLDNVVYVELPDAAS